VVFSVGGVGGLVVDTPAGTPGPLNTALRGFSTIIVTPATAITLPIPIPIPIPAPTNSAPGAMVVGGQTLQVPGASQVVVASTTLSPGGPAVTASGSVWSVDSAGGLVVVPAGGNSVGAGAGAGSASTTGSGTGKVMTSPSDVTPLSGTNVGVGGASGSVSGSGGSTSDVVSSSGAVGSVVVVGGKTTTVRVASPTIGTFKGSATRVGRSWSLLKYFMFVVGGLWFWI